MPRGRATHSRPRRRARREQRFDLIFTGTWDTELDRDQVLTVLAGLFQLSEPGAVEGFLDRGPVALRRNLPRARASTLLDELAGQGLHCHLAPFDEQAPTLPETSNPGSSRATHGSSATAVQHPNLFALSAYRPPADRAAQLVGLAVLERRLRRGTIALVLGCTLFMGILSAKSPEPEITAIDAVATGPGGELLLRSGPWLALHDRGGNGILQLHRAALEIGGIEPRPFLLLEDRRVLLRGAPVDGQAESLLLNCRLRAPRGCEASARLPAPILASAPLPGPVGPEAVVLAPDTAEPGLVRMLPGSGTWLEAPAAAGAGQVRAIASRGGLLYAADRNGAMLSVLSPDAVDFGRRLDLVLLSTPGDPRLEAQVMALAPLGTEWLVLLKPAGGIPRLWRFSDDWQALAPIDLPGPAPPLDLVPWGRRVLVPRAGTLELARVGAEGRLEVPFQSPLLITLRREQLATIEAHAQRKRATAVMGALALACGTLAVALLRRRRLDLEAREPEPCPLDLAHAQRLQWLRRSAPLAFRTMAARVAGTTAVAVLLLALTGAPPISWLAFLVGALAAGFGLASAARDGLSAVAVGDDRVMLVDHRGCYHGGQPADICLCGPFLFRDDVMVLLGNRHLPCFERAEAVARGCRKRGATAASWSQVALRLALTGHPCLWVGAGVLAVFLGVAGALLAALAA